MNNTTLQYLIDAHHAVSNMPNSYLEERKRKLIRSLIRHMGNMEPFEEPTIDGKMHEYDAYIDEEHKKAWYLAAWNPFEEQELSLFCSYGLLNDKNIFTYSSALPLSDKNKN